MIAMQVCEDDRVYLGWFVVLLCHIMAGRKLLSYSIKGANDPKKTDDRQK